MASDQASTHTREDSANRPQMKLASEREPLPSILEFVGEGLQAAQAAQATVLPLPEERRTPQEAMQQPTSELHLENQQAVQDLQAVQRRISTGDYVSGRNLSLEDVELVRSLREHHATKAREHKRKQSICEKLLQSSGSLQAEPSEEEHVGEYVLYKDSGIWNGSVESKDVTFKIEDILVTDRCTGTKAVVRGCCLDTRFPHESFLKVKELLGLKRKNHFMEMCKGKRSRFTSEGWKISTDFVREPAEQILSNMSERAKRQKVV